MDRHLIDGHKLHLHPNRVTQWKEGKPIFPIYIEISPVGQCNHRCTFCAVDYIGYKLRKIETGVLKNALESMGKNGVRSVMFAGEGEPMLHPDIAELTIWAKKSGLDVAFTTNATALTDKFIHLALADVTWLKVSLNAGNAQVYSKIHQTKEKDWERVWDNIERAVDYRNAKGLKTSIGVQCLLLPDNASTLPSLAQKCVQVGVDYLVIKPYSQHHKSITRTYENISYKDYYSSILSNLQQFATSKFEIVARVESMKAWDSEDRGYHKCYSTPNFWAYIMASGDVYGCSAYLEDPRFNYGNINNKSFESIWLGEKRMRSIAYVEKELDIKECRKNCRMNKVNQYLWDLRNPGDHQNFI